MYPFLYIRLPVLKQSKNFLGNWGTAAPAPSKYAHEAEEIMHGVKNVTVFYYY